MQAVDETTLRPFMSYNGVRLTLDSDDTACQTLCALTCLHEAVQSMYEKHPRSITHLQMLCMQA